MKRNLDFGVNDRFWPHSLHSFLEYKRSKSVKAGPGRQDRLAIEVDSEKKSPLGTNRNHNQKIFSRPNFFIINETSKIFLNPCDCFFVLIVMISSKYQTTEQKKKSVILAHNYYFWNSNILHLKKKFSKSDMKKRKNIFITSELFLYFFFINETSRLFSNSI